MFIPASRNIISACKLLTIIYGHYIDYIILAMTHILAKR